MSNISNLHEKYGIFGVAPIIMNLDKRLRPNERLVYQVLTSFQGISTNCNPSHKQIAERSGLSPEAVSKSVKRLEKLGWIDRTRKYNGQNDVYTCLCYKEPIPDFKQTDGRRKNNFVVKNPEHGNFPESGNNPHLESGNNPGLNSGNNPESYIKDQLKDHYKRPIKAEKEISAFGDTEIIDLENENASKDETLNSSNQEKKEKSSAQKEKKGRRPRKPVEPLHTPLKQVFLKKYEAGTGLSYYWTAADGKNLNGLIAKIRKTFEDQGKETSHESITDFFQIMLDNLPQWIRNGAYSVKVINAKYNEVLNNMKNGKSTNRRHDPARVMAKLAEYD